MCRPSQLVATAVLPVALMLACTEQQSPTVPISSAPTTPSFARGGNGGGAIISRGELLIGLLVIDEERGLTTLIGVPSEEISGLISCGGTGETEALGLLSVTRPTGATKFLLKSDESTVVVWQLVSGDVCGVLATTEPYAEGTARFQYTDNDFDFPIEPGGNAATLRALGTVTVLESGEELRYHAFAHTTARPGSDSFDDIRVITSKILLR